MTSTFCRCAGERESWSCFARAARAVPSPVLQGMMAAALLCALLPAMAIALDPASWFAAPEPVAVLLPAADLPEPVRSRCQACGVVESIRALAPVAGLPATYELNVRLRDGSLRTSSMNGKGSWRVGDHILLVGGSARP
jgi:hypothetical protein